MATQALAWAALAAVAAAGAASGLHALLHKRDPRSQLGWTVLCVLVPVAGASLYWLAGVNRIRTRARRWQAGGRFAIEGTAAQLSGSSPERAEQLAPLLRLSETVTGWPLLPGNRVAVLHSGDQTYPAMLEAIAGARQHVHLCTYLFEGDRTGASLVEALGAAAARGVTVRVLVDGVGERYGRPRVRTLFRRHPQVRYAEFLPPSLSPRSIHLNLRNHRKILSIDGDRGFTGGINIGGRNLLLAAGNANPTEDLHFRVEGPAVAFMEETFGADWFFTTGEDIGWRPPAEPPRVGAVLCRGIADGPNEDFERLQWVLIGALSVARRHVRIMTPYLIPSAALIAALNAAALRGVRVQVIVPARSNLRLVDWATCAMLPELLQHGVELYYRPAPFAHSKLLVIDDDYVLVGSANLDPRSLRLNFEFNMEMFDAELAAQLIAHFDDVRDRSSRVQLADNLARSLPVRLRDATAKLFSPYL